MSALGKAIKTENRRIKKVITAKQQELETAIAIPKARINIRDKIKEVYFKVKQAFSSKEEKIPFSQLVGNNNGEDQVSTFVPLLHLDNQHKVFLEQEKHLEEIYVWMKHHHSKKFAAELEQMRQVAEIEAAKLELEEDVLEEKREAAKEKVKPKKRGTSRATQKVSVPTNHPDPAHLPE